MTEDFSKYNAEGTPLREAQKASIDILVEFDRVCKKNNLTYWLDFGTLLGAVRQTLRECQLTLSGPHVEVCLLHCILKSLQS